MPLLLLIVSIIVAFLLKLFSAQKIGQSIHKNVLLGVTKI